MLSKKTILIILFLFLQNNFSNSQINFQIIMKINNQIITSFDLEKERNYLLILNPKLIEIDENDLIELAKRSLIKEKIKKDEIIKYKEINLQNTQINDVLVQIIKNLNFTNQTQLENYLKNFDISINDLKEKIEIENEWKNLIYAKYSKSIKIDKKNLIEKINKIEKEEFLFEYNLSEIVFEKEQNISLEEQSKIIFSSIEDIGFENTANLFSISESSKVGGKIGWVKKNNLSDEIIQEINNIKVDIISSPIQIGNNYLILKINEVKKIPKEIDKQKELDKMIMIETSKQLDKFSNIFYNKIKLNSTISEF